MKRRTRVLAGLLALAALTLSFAETVLASTCAPMPVAMGDMGPTGGEAPDPPRPMDCPLMANHGQRPDRGEHCPLNPAAGQGCAAAAALPASLSRSAPPDAEGSRRVVIDDARPDLLLAHARFRPPRA